MLSGMISSVVSGINTSGTNLAIDSDATFVAGAIDNIAIGNSALNSATGDTDDNIAIGNDALTEATNNNGNIAIGSSALAASVNDGDYNV